MTADTKPADPKQDQVNLAMLDVVEKRQSLGAAATTFLAVLVSLTLSREDVRGAVTLWVLLVCCAGAGKLFLSRYRQMDRFTGVRPRARRSLILLSAASTGLLWSLPMAFVDFRNPVELATVVLITSGIISGSVSTYLGSPPCIALIATLPCLSIVTMMATRMTPPPFATIFSVATFYAFIVSLSFKTHENAADLFRMKFENVDLIENLKKTRNTLLCLANKDDLTGLPNRRLLAERFDEFASAAASSNRKLGVLFIDMNKFKPINDLYGHETGDRVLVEAGNIMKASLRDIDIVARLGGDEFAALIKDMQSPREAILAADTLSKALDTTLHVDEHAIRISASIGVSIFPDQSELLDELLRLSDKSMYAGKDLPDGH